MRPTEKTPAEALHDLWLAIVEVLRLEQLVRWLDRQLRRRPWLYDRLGRKP